MLKKKICVYLIFFLFSLSLDANELIRHLDTSLPIETASDQVLGIYGNILYPHDQEQLQLKKLEEWIEVCSEDPFPLSQEDLYDVSLYILDRFPGQILRHRFANVVQRGLLEGKSVEDALEAAKKEAHLLGFHYQETARKIPLWQGRCEILISKLLECSKQVESIVQSDVEAIRKNPDEALHQILGNTSIDLIHAPYTWEIRLEVFRQMIDKVTSLSPNCPYFLALQEVTPQALSDLKCILKDRDLQWISFNNISGKKTLDPRQERILGESTGFTSTMALSRDLEILKVELGDLPTESGSVRKILGVRVRNTHTNDIYDLFTTHTDHKIQNDIYARTAAKIHEFATQFFGEISAEQQFVFGGDLNAFDQLGGSEYVGQLRKLFVGSQDFRETDYYAPGPIAWSTFIGRQDDAHLGRIENGIVEASGLDQVIVGKGIELQSAGREGAVYNKSGKLLDFYESSKEYVENLQKRITFSDHFFNIVRFKSLIKNLPSSDNLCMQN